MYFIWLPPWGRHLNCASRQIRRSRREVPDIPSRIQDRASGTRLRLGDGDSLEDHRVVERVVELVGLRHAAGRHHVEGLRDSVWIEGAVRVGAGGGADSELVAPWGRREG